MLICFHVDVTIKKFPFIHFHLVGRHFFYLLAVPVSSIEMLAKIMFYYCNRLPKELLCPLVPQGDLHETGTVN